MNESTFAFYWLGIAFGIAFGFPMAQFICKIGSGIWYVIRWASLMAYLRLKYGKPE